MKHFFLTKIAIILLFFIFSCSTTEKTTQKEETSVSHKNQLPKGVICTKDKQCEVKDLFEANIDVFKKCLTSQYPQVIENYDGHSIIIRVQAPVPAILKAKTYAVSAKSIAKYFDILAELYYRDYQQDIKEHIKNLITYEETEKISEKEIVKKLFVKIDLSNLQTLGYLANTSNGAHTCKYFNVDSYIRRRFLKIMPNSFKENLDKLLTETDKEFNKYMKENSKYDYPEYIDNLGIKQQYYTPTPEQIKNFEKKLKKSKPLIVYFCDSAIMANETKVECHDPEKEEINILDIIELSYLPFLTELDLTGTKIKNLSALKHLKRLKRIQIAQDQFDKEELKTLRNTLPTIKLRVYSDEELEEKEKKDSF